MHSERVKNALIEEGISQETVQKVIKTLKTGGFLNDSEYVEHFVQKWVNSGKSRPEIYKKAHMQAIPRHELEKFLVDDNQAIRVLIERRYPILLDKNGDKNLKTKAIRSLLLKGFSFEIINQNKV